MGGVLRQPEFSIKTVDGNKVKAVRLNLVKINSLIKTNKAYMKKESCWWLAP